MNDSSESSVRWTLQLDRIPDLPPSLEVPEEGLTLGRDPANDVAVPPSVYPGVSARHARLTVRGNRLILKDLESKNGTLIGGESIVTHELLHGDVFELGTGGPRFTALSSAGTEDTMVIPRPLLEPEQKERSIGDDTMQIVRRRLGIPANTDVSSLVRRRTRRNAIAIVLVALAIIAGGIYAFRQLMDRGQQEVATLQRQTDDLQREFDEQLGMAHEAAEELRQAWIAQGQRLDEASKAWESDKQRLEGEREQLQGRIGNLEDDDRSAAGILESLQQELDDTSRALELYNPVSIEEARLGIVSRVERSVVLIEADLLFKNQTTGEILYFDTKPDGTASPNFEAEGEPVKSESSGSGFCVGPEGWIVTNAHVVYKKGKEGDPIEISPDFTLIPALRLNVVFSGKSERHPAKLVKWAGEDKEDLALIKIEPFEGMPHLPELDLGVPEPKRGTDVYLIGFPLGKKALQQGDTVIASTFRGIVSRRVDQFLQVDAAVHPGASGGPLINAKGTVLGVVTAMQAVDLVSGSSAIGYIIPIAAASKVWPPE